MAGSGSTTSEARHALKLIAALVVFLLVLLVSLGILAALGYVVGPFCYCFPPAP